MKGMLKAVIYCRVSTDGQAEHGTSMEAQEAACRKKAEDLKAQVVRVCNDPGVSGALYLTREGIQAALTSIEEGEANTLIIYKLDRSGRDVDVIRAIRNRVEAAGARMVFADGVNFENNAFGNLAFNTLAGFAEYEKEVIRERCMGGKRKLAEGGLMPLRVKSPYGYHIIRKGEARDYPGKTAGEYVIVEAEARWVREIFDRYSRGESAYKICNYLHATQVPTPNGGFEWRQSTLKSLLKNATYKGTAAYGKTKARRDENRKLQGFNKVNYVVPVPSENWVTIQVPALVDEDTWERCQQRVQENIVLRGKPSQKYMLTSLLKCPLCGQAMGGMKDGKQRQYLTYKCRQHAKSRNTTGIVCNKKRYNGRLLELTVIAAIVQAGRQPHLLEEAFAAYEEREQATDLTIECERLQAEINALDAREHKTIELQVEAAMKGRSTGTYDKMLAEYDQKRGELVARHKELTVQLRRSAGGTPKDRAHKVANVLASIERVLTAEELTAAEKQAVLASIVHNVVPSDEKVIITLKPSNEQIIKTACPHDCPDTCSMLARVETLPDGTKRLLSVAGNPDNSYTQGNLCRKVAHYEDRVYSPDRLLHPMRRVGKKGEGKFERISWDEAIAEIASRWKDIIAESGPEAIQPYSYAGTMGVVSMSACEGRLWNRMGAGHLQRTICSAAAEAGYSYVYGWSGGIDPESFADSKFIIAWGTNLSSTNVHLMPYIRAAQARGATFVVIDPYRTRTANAADWFVQPYPGTDAALALGMANVIFTEGLHDERFLAAHSVGWRAFRERCCQYPPEHVAAITGLPAEEIVRLARAYATQGPSAIRLGYGLSRTGNGGGMIRAIATLPAVIGAWGKPGSGLLLSTSGHFPGNPRGVKRPDLQVEPDSQSPTKWGRKKPRAINMNEIGRALLEETDPPIRSLFVFNSNPAGVAPDSNRVLAGLSREDLFTVVHEQMLTDTARYADILLPATTQLECLDLMRAYGHLYVNLCQPAIPPLGESRANIDVQNALARAMGYTESAFHETAEDIIRAALDVNSPLLEGITYEYLLEHGFAKLKTPTDPFIPYAALQEEAGENPQISQIKSDASDTQQRATEQPLFRTMSGKVELYSQRAERDGYDPLPDYEPAAESREADPELAAEFPINLLTPAAHHFLNTSFANQPELQKGEREPRIWINTQDAAARNIADGDWLRVWNRRGEVRLKAVVGESVKPGVAWSPSLWWHRDSPDNRNVNALTSARLTDMGGGSTFHTNLIQFESLETQ